MNKFINFFILTSIRLLSMLPLQLKRILAKTLAWLYCLNSSSKTYQAVHKNLIIAHHQYPELIDIKKINQLTYQSIQSQALSMFEFIHIWHRSLKSNLARIQHIEGHQLLIDAIASKKGLMLIVPHFGTWELLNDYISQYTAPTIMYKPSKNQALDQVMLRARSKQNATLCPTDESGVRTIFRTLKQGGTTAILPDHTPKHSGGIYSHFFSLPLLTSSLAAKLVSKTKCHMLIASCVRQDNGQFNLVFRAIDYDQTADLQHMVDLVQAETEQLILSSPLQYHWSYRRFKSNPALSKIYQMDDEEMIQFLHQFKKDPTTLL